MEQQDEKLGWIPASNGAGPRHWFVFHHERVRSHQGTFAERYYTTKTGKLVRFGSHQSAQRMADKLNRAANCEVPV